MWYTPEGRNLRGGLTERHVAPERRSWKASTVDRGVNQNNIALGYVIPMVTLFFYY